MKHDTSRSGFLWLESQELALNQLPLQFVTATVTQLPDVPVPEIENCPVFP